MIPEIQRSTLPSQFLIDSSDSILITYSYRFVYRSAYDPPPRLAIISRMLIPHEQDEVFPVLNNPSVLEIKESCCDKCSAFYYQHLEPFSETTPTSVPSLIGFSAMATLLFLIDVPPGEGLKPEIIARFAGSVALASRRKE